MPWDAAIGLERVRRGEAGQPRHALVDLGVVLHGAGAERVEAEVDRGVPGGQAREVAHDLDLGELGQARQVVAHGVGAEAAPRGRPQARRCAGSWQPTRPGPAALEEQRLLVGRRAVTAGVSRERRPCASLMRRRAPARLASRRSICARVASSVVQTSTAGPSSGAYGARSRPADDPLLARPRKRRRSGVGDARRRTR